MTATLHWTGTLTATSSISHGGQTRGTITLLRRELVMQPDGRTVHIPIVSGNSLRGRLRRIGEELLRDTLGYDRQLTLSAAHALRGGGALAKTSSAPLSGRRLADLRALIPQVGVFGCAGGGRIIDGCLQVGKVVPHLTETLHILPTIDQRTAGPPAFDATQVETYIRADDSNDHDFTPISHRIDVDTDGQPHLDQLPTEQPDTHLMLFRVETFPAGTRFATWLRLDRATDLEVAFFTDLLAAYTADGRLGGRAAIGHGQVTVDLKQTVLAGRPHPADWRAYLTEHRTAALTALQALT